MASLSWSIHVEGIVIAVKIKSPETCISIRSYQIVDTSLIGIKAKASEKIAQLIPVTKFCLTIPNSINTPQFCMMAMHMSLILVEATEKLLIQCLMNITLNASGYNL